MELFVWLEENIRKHMDDYQLALRSMRQPEQTLLEEGNAGEQAQAKKEWEEETQEWHSETIRVLLVEAQTSLRWILLRKDLLLGKGNEG